MLKNIYPNYKWLLNDYWLFNACFRFCLKYDYKVKCNIGNIELFEYSMTILLPPFNSYMITIDCRMWIYKTLPGNIESWPRTIVCPFHRLNKTAMQWWRWINKKTFRFGNRKKMGCITTDDFGFIKRTLLLFERDKVTEVMSPRCMFSIGISPSWWDITIRYIDLLAPCHLSFSRTMRHTNYQIVYLARGMNTLLDAFEYQLKVE